MKYSKIFGKTVREDSKDIKLTSHKLLFKAGFIRESVAGRYYFLPLGNLVRQKIIDVIRNELNQKGAQEILSPGLQPLDLWKETKRVASSNFELITVKDRRGAEFALGGTAEEMIVDLVRKFQISYKDLPFNIYQFSTKNRDEIRARGGLIRTREFTMKDGYSFHASSEDFEKEYMQMWEAYSNIFKKLGLEAVAVPADNGYFGGDYCHEFDVVCEAGESKFFASEDGKYVAHEDVAVFRIEDKNVDSDLLELQQVDAQRGNTMIDGVAFHNMPDWQQLKDVMFTDREGKLFLAIIRGDLDVNKNKLEKLVDRIGQLEPATEEQIREVGSEPGFISPVGLEDKLTIVADKSIRTVKNFYGGANQKFKDFLNMNIDRDFKAHIEADIALAKQGYLSLEGSKLIEKVGIEVGNIFQLGQHYSKLMKGANFIDESGTEKEYYMGCYGIGVERTMATIVEIHNDEKGIVWPDSIAPFLVHIVSIGKINDEAYTKAQELYEMLLKNNIEVLWDEREESAGVKLSDADLIGIPYRVVVSSRSIQNGGFEVKRRSEEESKVMSMEDLIEMLKS